jgi:tetratricopeptide (TPR) repeat protein
MSRVFRFRTLLVVLAVIVITGAHSGCALYPQSKQLLYNPPVDLPSYHALQDVPFFAQDEYQCGPAALAMMLSYRAVRVSPDDLVSKVYVPEQLGTFQIELRAATRSYGLVPYVLPNSMEALFREVAAGNPVLVLQNLGLDILPQWHYAVVIGYDLAEGDVILHSGEDESIRMALATFERSWVNNAQAWGMLALLPSELPNQITPLQLAQNAEDMNAVGRPEVAMTLYEVGLERWPGNDLLTFGTGNLDYQHGHYVSASEHFLKMLEYSPKDIRAWNNLAYSLAQQGCMQALDVAQCATKLAKEHDRRSDAIASTFSEIKAILSNNPYLSEGNAKVCDTVPSCPQ